MAIAGFSITPMRLALYTLAATAVTAWLIVALSHRALFAPLALVVPLAVPLPRAADGW